MPPSQPGSGPVTLLSVPLSLCLSHELPGCCPSARRSPALRALFASEEPWEVKLAAALVWACRRHAAQADGRGRCGQAGSAGGNAAVSSTAGDAKSGSSGRSEERSTRDGDDGCAGVAPAAAPASSPDTLPQGFGAGPRAPAAVGAHAAAAATEGAEADAADAAFADFWRRYRALLPAPDSLTTLLSFSAEELRELQDASLAARARSWQAAVLAAFERWLAAPAFRREAGRVALREWLAAVGAVESRAFGFRAPDGRELHAYVPLLCCANYQPGAPTLHVLRLQPGDAVQPEGPHEQATGERRPGTNVSDTAPGSASRAGGAGRYGDGGGVAAWQPTVDMLALRLPQTDGSANRPGQESSPPAAAQQLYIDYGRKDNRSLVEQYGFILYGNPYDRLEWGSLRLDPASRIRRDWVLAAAQQLAEEAGAGAGAAGAPATSALEASLPDAADAGAPCGGGLLLLPALGQQGGAEAARARLRSAAASVVAVAGWRNMRERRAITPASERRAVVALARWVEAELASFPTGAQQDAQELASMVAPGVQAGRHEGEEEGGGDTRGNSAGDMTGVQTHPCLGASAAEEGCDPAAAGCRSQVGEGHGGFGRGVQEGGSKPTGALRRRLPDAAGSCTARRRLRLALSYRLERKLLLWAAHVLLRRLERGCIAPHGDEPPALVE